MSKLFYRFKSLSNYLKCHKLLDDSYEPILFKSKSESEIIDEYIKSFSLLDYSYNVPFNDKYTLTLTSFITMTIIKAG